MAEKTVVPRWQGRTAGAVRAHESWGNIALLQNRKLKRIPNAGEISVTLNHMIQPGGPPTIQVAAPVP
jgi:hypothetical protein